MIFKQFQSTKGVLSPGISTWYLAGKADTDET